MESGEKRVVAFDPGKRTGIAVWGNGVHTTHDMPEDEAMDWFQVARLALDVVVCESIIITAYTAKKSQDVQSSIRQIGYLQHTCRQHEIPFHLQTPVEKGFGTDDILRKLDWWTKGSDHARDASRHLALHLASTDPEFRARLV